MSYRFDKPFNKTAYSEWLSTQLEAMAADLDRQIKAEEERTKGADSEFIKDARRRRDNLWLSSDRLKRTFERGQSEKRAPASDWSLKRQETCESGRTAPSRAD